VDVEKTIEFILEQQAHAAAMQVKFEEDLARLEESFARLGESFARLGESFARREKLADRTDRRLDRAIRLAVREARNERLRRQELDARLTAAQSRHDERVDKLAENVNAFIESMRRGGNGRQ